MTDKHWIYEGFLLRISMAIISANIHAVYMADEKYNVYHMDRCA